MKHKIFLIIFLLFPMVLQSQPEKKLAELYTGEARYYFENDQFALAEKYIDEAKSFFDGCPETWYISGLLGEEQGNRLKALDDYKRSISLGDVYSPYFYDLYYRYLNLLNITLHHKEVLDFYKENEEIFDRDNDIILKVSDSAYRYGLIDYSTTLAEDVYEMDPYNLKSMLYIVRSTGKIEFYDKIRMSLYNLEKDHLDEIVFQSLMPSDNQDESEELLDLYKDIFGATEYYYQQKGIDHESIGRSRNLMIRSSGSDFLDDGVYFGDYNFDGISDEIVSVSGRELTYMRDSDQDNITDLSIHFIDSLPKDIFINDENMGLEFKYSEYPYIEEIHATSGEAKRIYKIFPGTEITLLRDLSAFDWKYNSNRDSLTVNKRLIASDLLNISYEFDEYIEGKETVHKKYGLIDGEIVSISADSRNTGFFDYFLDLEAWQPIQGRRDLNDDGVIDLYEYYDEGMITGIAIDWNNNGKPEYLEDWSILNIKTWDFDEDRLVDAEYIASSNDLLYHIKPVEKEQVKKYDIYSWDFSFENFWFNNN